MNLSFKICTIGQLDTLVKIPRETFISAFEKENNPDDFRSYMDTAFNNKTLKAELLNTNTLFYFVYLKNNLVGYFKLNEKEAQNEQFAKQSIELERIYILNKFQGQNIGKHALFKIIGLAKTKGVAFLWLGVWKKNDAAIRFYKRHAFKKLGNHPYYLGKDKQTDLLLKISLK